MQMTMPNIASTPSNSMSWLLSAGKGSYPRFLCKILVAGRGLPCLPEGFPKIKVFLGNPCCLSEPPRELTESTTVIPAEEK